MSLWKGHRKRAGHLSQLISDSFPSSPLPRGKYVLSWADSERQRWPSWFFAGGRTHLRYRPNKELKQRKPRVRLAVPFQMEKRGTRTLQRQCRSANNGASFHSGIFEQWKAGGGRGAGGAPQIKEEVIRQSKFNRNDSPSCWQLWCLHTAQRDEALLNSNHRWTRQGQGRLPFTF